MRVIATVLFSSLMGCAAIQPTEVNLLKSRTDDVKELSSNPQQVYESQRAEFITLISKHYVNAAKSNKDGSGRVYYSLITLDLLSGISGVLMPVNATAASGLSTLLTSGLLATDTKTNKDFYEHCYNVSNNSLITFESKWLASTEITPAKLKEFESDKINTANKIEGACKKSGS